MSLLIHQLTIRSSIQFQNKQDMVLLFLIGLFVISAVKGQYCPSTVLPCGTGKYPYGGPVSLLHGYAYIITSPNYPNDYPGVTLCTWEFMAPTDKEVEIQFQHFSVSNLILSEIRLSKSTGHGGP